MSISLPHSLSIFSLPSLYFSFIVGLYITCFLPPSVFLSLSIFLLTASCLCLLPLLPPFFIPSLFSYSFCSFTPLSITALFYSSPHFFLLLPFLFSLFHFGPSFFPFLFLLSFIILSFPTSSLFFPPLLSIQPSLSLFCPPLPLYLLAFYYYDPFMFPSLFPFISVTLFLSFPLYLLCAFKVSLETLVLLSKKTLTPYHLEGALLCN